MLTGEDKLASEGVPRRQTVPRGGYVIKAVGHCKEHLLRATFHMFPLNCEHEEYTVELGSN